MMQQTALPNTFIMAGRNPRIFTKNLTPGKTFFENEAPYRDGATELREADPRHSKLLAAVARGGQQFGVKEGGAILYLGASHGYTPSFVSDMVGEKGIVYCVDVAPRVVRDLVFLCEARRNLVPILANAADPSTFYWRIGAVDAVFQDIAQRDQTGIFLRNCRAFLPVGGVGMLALKARSVDVTRHPKDVFKDVKRQLEVSGDFVIIDYRELDPFERDHAFFVVKRRK